MNAQPDTEVLDLAGEAPDKGTGRPRPVGVGASHARGWKAAVLLAASLNCLLPSAVSAFEVSSYAFVNDDGTLRIRNRTFRLFGIYVPRMAYTCQRFTLPVTCASQPRLALEFKIDSKFVHCIGDGQYADGTHPAYCDVDGYDLGVYLLEQGFAMALPDAPLEYMLIERIARSRGTGVWAIPGQDLYRFPP